MPWPNSRPTGRAGSHVHGKRQGIDTILRPKAGAGPPAEFSSRSRMKDARRAMPGHARFPFGVGIVGEQFAVGIQRHVVGIAKADGKDFPLPAVGIGGGDPAIRCQQSDPRAPSGPIDEGGSKSSSRLGERRLRASGPERGVALSMRTPPCTAAGQTGFRSAAACDCRQSARSAGRPAKVARRVGHARRCRECLSA